MQSTHSARCSRIRFLLAFTLLVAWGACQSACSAPTLLEGVYACEDSNEDCPSGWICWNGLCYRQPPTTDAGVEPCAPVGAFRCDGSRWQECVAQGWVTMEECHSEPFCVEEVGCVECLPGDTTCLDNNVVECSSAHAWSIVESCGPDLFCVQNACHDPCSPDSLGESNLGCEFWAVDLDNEATTSGGIANDAAAAQFGLTVANPQGSEVQVDVYVNSGRVGEPPSDTLVTTRAVPPAEAIRIDLPQREVDGCMGQNGPYVISSGSGTFVSSHAYRISSNGPVAVFQHNPIVDQFSNDGSLLLPAHRLGTSYRVVGWPVANPCQGPMPMESIPDHAAVTIVGLFPGTEVTVLLTHPVMASSGDSGLVIPETQAGVPLSLTIGPYDVVNLESLAHSGDHMECGPAGLDGDFTGTTVTSSQPVAVFSSHERGNATADATPPDPPDWDGEECCTDHLEQQLPPVSTLGRSYVIARSPVRSQHATYREPDLYRILAVDASTSVTTSLPFPFDQFGLAEGEHRTLYADTGFIVESATGALLVSQHLVPTGRVLEGTNSGDPSFLVIPPWAQFNQEHFVAVPDTFPENYLVLTLPTGITVHLNGDALDANTADCLVEPIGSLEAISYEQLTCAIQPGMQHISASDPIGVAVYGYGLTASSAFPGGQLLRTINP